MPANNKDDPLRYVTRVKKNQKTLAWRLGIHRKNKYIQKHFADSMYGGKNKALQAALLYRDEYLKTFDIDDYAVWSRTLKKATNTSGIAGVARYGITNKNGSKYFSWHAFWKGADNKYYQRVFSVKKYGERKAKALACETRKKGIEEVESILRTKKEKEMKEWRAQVKIVEPVKKLERPVRARSGIAGVGRYMQTLGNYKYIIWKASWAGVDGKRKTRAFSINIHGERGAKRLAIAAREEGVKEVARLREK